jgi:cell division protein FtsW
MLKPGHVLAISCLALLTLGVVMVNSALMDIGRPVTVESVLLSRSTIYMGLAMLALLVVSRLPILRFIPGAVGASSLSREEDRPHSGWQVKGLWIGSGIMVVTLLLVYVPGIAREVNGAHRWLNLPLPGLGDLSVQPSEIAKWGLIVLMAWYCLKMGPRLSSFVHGLLPALVAGGVVGLVIVKEDLGTAVLIALVAAIVLIAGGARIWHFLAMIPLGVLAFVAAVLANPYRLTRLETFVNPYADPEGTGYHMIQSMLAVSAGGVTGRGLGYSIQKFGYLPEDQTDFIFAIICEELGVAGAALVCTLYAGIIWAGLRIIAKAPSLVLKLVTLGVISTVGVQALINMAVVTGLGPTKGIALPLLSSGGTGWILTAACLGLLINIDRYSDRLIMARLARMDDERAREAALRIDAGKRGDTDQQPANQPQVQPPQVQPPQGQPPQGQPLQPAL